MLSDGLAADRITLRETAEQHYWSWEGMFACMPPVYFCALGLSHMIDAVRVAGERDEEVIGCRFCVESRTSRANQTGFVLSRMSLWL